jgi:predicted O-linked N-acetylglucosamine transferase (SPINDLY family)
MSSHNRPPPTIAELKERQAIAAALLRVAQQGHNLLAVVSAQQLLEAATRKLVEAQKKRIAEMNPDEP